MTFKMRLRNLGGQNLGAEIFLATEVTRALRFSFRYCFDHAYAKLVITSVASRSLAQPV